MTPKQNSWLEITMPATDAITIIKRFTYRGVGEEWSNTYHLDGTTPTSPAEWLNLATNVAATEKSCYDVNTKIVRAYGYISTDPLKATWQHDFTALGTEIAGNLITTGQQPWAGDQAGWVRMKSVVLSLTGKPVYARKYFHGGCSPTGAADSVSANLKENYVTHANAMTGGLLPGGMKWVTPTGNALSLPAASPYVTTRTLKRRSPRALPIV